MSFFNNKPLVLTVIVLILLIVALFITSATTEAGGVQSVVGRLIAPMQEGLYSVTDSIADWVDGLIASPDMELENSRLRERVAELESELLDYEELRLENERLKQMVNIVDTYQTLEPITARVIGRSPGVWQDEFTINAGTDHGIRADMPVITEKGLVGRVVETGPTYSKVMTIVNSMSGVSAVVERTRENCVVQGNSPDLGDVDEHVMRLAYLTKDADVEPGDRVLTSGNDSLFPKGLVIGTVSEVSRDTASDRLVLMISDVDFANVEEVIVLKEAAAS